jgi:quinol monooxygenase YgiN
MYGTVARMKFKPGMAQQFMQMRLQQGDQRRAAAGSVGVYVYQMDQDPNEVYLVVMFESKAAYVANANSPEQHQDFLQLMDYLESEPEWHDGEIVWQGT